MVHLAIIIIIIFYFLLMHGRNILYFLHGKIPNASSKGRLDIISTAFAYLSHSERHFPPTHSFYTIYLKR